MAKKKIVEKKEDIEEVDPEKAKEVKLPETEEEESDFDPKKVTSDEGGDLDDAFFGDDEEEDDDDENDGFSVGGFDEKDSW
jgi:hypothetical protein